MRPRNIREGGELEKTAPCGVRVDNSWCRRWLQQAEWRAVPPSVHGCMSGDGMGVMRSRSNSRLRHRQVPTQLERRAARRIARHRHGVCATEDLGSRRCRTQAWSSEVRVTRRENPAATTAAMPSATTGRPHARHHDGRSSRRADRTSVADRPCQSRAMTKRAIAALTAEARRGNRGITRRRPQPLRSVSPKGRAG